MSKSNRRKPRKLRNDFQWLNASAFIAAVSGDLAPLRACLASGVSPDSPCRGAHGRTLLFNSELPGGAAKVLLNAKANPRARDEAGFTPLHYAGVGAARHLLAFGADIEAEEPAFKGTPLLTQAALGRVGMVTFLLAHGANADAETTRGDTALSVAQQAGHTEVCDVIRRHKAATRRPALAAIAASSRASNAGTPSTEIEERRRF